MVAPATAASAARVPRRRHVRPGADANDGQPAAGGRRRGRTVVGASDQHHRLHPARRQSGHRIARAGATAVGHGEHRGVACGGQPRLQRRHACGGPAVAQVAGHDADQAAAVRGQRARGRIGHVGQCRRRRDDPRPQRRADARRGVQRPRRGRGRYARARRDVDDGGVCVVAAPPAPGRGGGWSGRCPGAGGRHVGRCDRGEPRRSPRRARQAGPDRSDL